MSENTSNSGKTLCPCGVESMPDSEFCFDCYCYWQDMNETIARLDL